MDSSAVPWATFILTAIGWITSEIRHWIQRKKDATKTTIVIINEKKALLQEMLNKIEEASQKEELGFQLDEVNAALLGLHSERLRRTLKDAGLPPEEALIADGLSQLQPEQVDQLKEEIAELETLPPSDSIWVLLAQGSAYYYAELYQDAKDTYDRVLELDPENSIALRGRGITYSQLGKNDEAMGDLNRSLELKNDDPAALHNRGIIYIRLGKYDKALADLNRSLEIRPDSPAVLYNLACLFSLWGKTDDALAYLEKAIALDDANREIAKTEKDLANIRDDPRFKKLVGTG